jgi:hypothetical protein
VAMRAAVAERSMQEAKSLVVPQIAATSFTHSCGRRAVP